MSENEGVKKHLEGLFFVWVRGLSAPYAVIIDTENAVMYSDTRIIFKKELDRGPPWDLEGLKKTYPCPITQPSV